jgi:hypothetical protein
VGFSGTAFSPFALVLMKAGYAKGSAGQGIYQFAKVFERGIQGIHFVPVSAFRIALSFPSFVFNFVKLCSQLADFAGANVFAKHATIYLFRASVIASSVPSHRMLPF